MASSFTAKALKATALALCVTLAGAAPSAFAETSAPGDVTELSPAELRRAAEKALSSGFSGLSYDIAAALLKRDDADIFALLIKSRSARNLGKFDVAKETARAAWRLAETDAAKYASAMAMAQAHSSDENRTLAQVWLRRAAHVAPTEATRDVAVRDFRYVRARNPWAVQLQFSVAPSNNINNGSARETTTLFGLPFEFQLEGAAQALEGIEYSAGVSGRYRLAQSETQAHDLTFQATHRSYALTADARAQAPGATGSDFSFSQVAAGYAFQRTPENGPGPFRLSATAGHSWYGGASYQSYLRFGAQQTVRLGDTASLRFGANVERQFGVQSGDADRVSANIALSKSIPKIGALTFSVGNTTSVSDEDIQDFSELTGGVSFKLAKPVLGTEISFGLSVRDRDYIRSRYDPSGRSDTEVTARIDMVFREIDQFGFNPTLSVVSSQTDSNVGLFDSNSMGLRLGIQSAF